jgi:hypothetical protein
MEAMSESATPAIPFPPQEIGDFLRFCAGEWMGLNSTFALDGPTALAAEDNAPPGASASEPEGDEWHTSERGELVVTYLEPQTGGEPGGLSQGPKGGLQQQLLFHSDGSYHCGADQGRWQFWPDGSLELVIDAQGQQVRERLWFTKPNLRLRSSVANQGDGNPAHAHFSSEIRRVSKA